MEPLRQAWVWVHTDEHGCLSYDSRAALHLADTAGFGLRAVSLRADSSAARWLGAYNVESLMIADTDEAESAALSLARTLEEAENPPQNIIAPGNAFGRDFMARLAARLGVPLLQDCVAVDLLKGYGEKYMLSGRTLGTFSMPKRMRCWTLRPQIFPPGPEPSTGKDVPVHVLPEVSGGFLRRLETLPASAESGAHTEDAERFPSWPATPLDKASIVLCGGSALKSPDDFALLHTLARNLGAAVGATPEAVNKGYAPSSAQIGRTGAVVSPALYLAFGASGTLCHLAGIRTAGTIVAINDDPASRMLGSADYGVQENLTDALHALIRLTDKAAD